MRKKGFEYINTFEKALEAEEWRCSSQKFMNSCPHYFYNFLYFRSGLYGKQLENYFSLFPKEKFHVIKFENFIVNPNSHFKKIFHFLDVDPEFSAEFDIHNAGGMTERFPKLRYYAKVKIKKPIIVRNTLLKLLNRVKKIDVPPLHKGTRKLLLNRYSDDLNLLHEMTGISFSD